MPLNISTIRQILQDSKRFQSSALGRSPDAPQSPTTNANQSDINNDPLERIKPFLRVLSRAKERADDFGFKFQKPGFGKPAIIFPGKAGKTQQYVSEFFAPEPGQEIFETALNFSPMGVVSRLEQKTAQEVAPKVFTGFKDLTTKFLDYAKGKTVLSKQEIVDFARRPELKKGEADLLNKKVTEFEGDKLPAQEFTDSIRRDLLELKPVKVGKPQYEMTTIGDKRSSGYPPNKNYEEVVFESPITTNGSSHFPNSKNYFAHARGDEVVEGGKKIWREQEIQSDLLQKEGMEDFGIKRGDKVKLDGEEYKVIGRGSDTVDLYGKEGEITVPTSQVERPGISQLSPFTNDRFGERIMRERIKEKAGKGYEKYRLPTGSTIGKIEGFADDTWQNTIPRGTSGWQETGRLTPETLKVGNQVKQSGSTEQWIVTDILDNGRFKAVQKDLYNKVSDYSTYVPNKSEGKQFETIKRTAKETLDYIQKHQPEWKETFDLTGKSNPQAKRYENWGKFLKNKYGGKEVTDGQGNSWMEIDLKKEQGRLPIEAFGAFAIPASVISEEDNEPPIVKMFRNIIKLRNEDFEKKQNIETLSQQFVGPDVQALQVGEIGSTTGSNYDPFQASQTKPNPDGKGSAGILMTNKMIAVSRLKQNTNEPILPYGTVVEVEGKRFLVADIKNQRFFGNYQFDFARPHSGDKTIPELNRDFKFKIIELGKGAQDAIEKAKRFQ